MGTRFGADSQGGDPRPKQFVKLGGKSMIMAAAEPFLHSGVLDEIVFVAPTGYAKHTCKLIVREIGGIWTHAKSNMQKLKFTVDGKDILITVLHGGKNRAASVRAGLDAVSSPGAADGGLVLIHDAARPFVTKDLIFRVLEAAFEHGAAVPVTRVNDTVYITGEDGFAAGIPDRLRLRGAQTPQGFDIALIREAHRRATEIGLSPTDDGAPVYACGGRVALVEGDPANIKITTQEDLPETWVPMEAGAGARVGIGFDAHRFESGRPLMLGGVKIPFEQGLGGHSDADVLIHALIDAILGAMHEGDIGKIFPDTDPVLKGVPSMALLKGVVSLMDMRGYEVENADMTVILERPRMADHCEAIEQRLASALGIGFDNVSLKATTTEKLGFTGREEGIAAEAVVLLKPKRPPKGGW